jgi:hypothetical protein
MPSLRRHLELAREPRFDRWTGGLHTARFRRRNRSDSPARAALPKDGAAARDLREAISGVVRGQPFPRTARTRPACCNCNAPKTAVRAPWVSQYRSPIESQNPSSVSSASAIAPGWRVYGSDEAAVRGRSGICGVGVAPGRRRKRVRAIGSAPPPPLQLATRPVMTLQVSIGRGCFTMAPVLISFALFVRSEAGHTKYPVHAGKLGRSGAARRNAVAKQRRL